MNDHNSPESLRRRHVLLSLASLVGVGASSRAWSQVSGGKPIRLVVPFTPGGSTDLIARVIGAKLSQSLGRTVVVDNKPGAGGSIGAAEVARASPDGDTLLMGHIGTLAVNVSLYAKLPYDPVKSFTPVAWVARVPNVLVVNPASGIGSLKELIDRAKAKPGLLTYASGGNGSAAHIAFEALKLRTQSSLTHVPYRGTAPAVQDVIAGQVDAIFTGTPAVLPHLKSGRLQSLAVSSLSRVPLLPQVPTVAENGFPGFEADQWYGIVAPAGTPAATVARLNAAINAVLTLPDVAQKFAEEGAEPVRMEPQAFAALITREIPRWRLVVRAGNMTAN